MVRPKLPFVQGGNGLYWRFFFTGDGRWAFGFAVSVEHEESGCAEWHALEAGASRYNVAVAFAIRDYKPEDFDTLWRLDQECFPSGIAYSRQELQAYIRHKATFTLVAACAGKKPSEDQTENGSRKGSQCGLNNEVQGFIVVHRGVIGHVITIDVKAGARRSGVGSSLLQAAEQRLREGRCSAVDLETAVDNVTALAFYKRHGYSVIRTWPRYYSNGVDALVLRKDLDSNT